MQITRIFERVLRWVLSGNCVACDKKISDLDPVCVDCDRPLRTEVADVPAESHGRNGGAAAAKRPLHSP